MNTTATDTHTGYINRIIANRGFGFISRTGAEDVFFHAYGLARDLTFDEMLQGRRVQYEMGSGDDGRPRAVNVRPAD